MTTQKIETIAAEMAINCSIDHNHDGGFACLSACASEAENSNCEINRDGDIWDDRGYWWSAEKRDRFLRQYV